MAEPDHISSERARAGSEPRMARFALAWGTGLVVIIFLILLFVWR